MRNFVMRNTFWIVAALSLGLLRPGISEACWLRDLFGGRACRQAYYPPTTTYAYPVTSSYYCPAPCPAPCPTPCNTCSPAPQTSFYGSVLSVPVTTFQPVQASGATCLQPCSTTSYQVQRAPVENYLSMPTWTTPASYSEGACATCPTTAGYGSASSLAPASSCDCSGAVSSLTSTSPYTTDASGVTATPWTPVSPSEANGSTAPTTEPSPADMRPTLPATPSSSSLPTSTLQRPRLSYTELGYQPAPWYPPRQAATTASPSAQPAVPFLPIPDPRPQRPRLERPADPGQLERDLFPQRGELHTAARPATRFDAVPIRWEVKPRAETSSDDVGDWRSLAQ